MNLQSDPDLRQCITQASSDLCAIVIRAITDERGAHLETAIAAAGFLAGTAMLKSTGVNTSTLPPGSPIFVDQVNEIGPAIVDHMLGLISQAQPTGAADLTASPASEVPQNHTPLRSMDDMLQLLWPQFRGIVARYCIPPQFAAYAAAGTAARFIIDGQKILPPAVGKAIALESMVKASKTVPPANMADLERPPKSLRTESVSRPNAVTGNNTVLPKRSKTLPVIAVAILALIVGGFMFSKFFKIKVEHGSPLGESARTSDQIATLISTLEPYVPSLHRNPENDRYRVSLFLYPETGDSKGKMIPIRDGLRASETSTLSGLGTRILGFDGKYLWLYVNEPIGVDPKNAKIIGVDELRRANPAMGDIWISSARNIAFSRRLRIATPDRSKEWEIDPASLVAVPAVREKTSIAAMLGFKVDSYFSAGALISATEWIGVHTKEEAMRDFAVGASISSENRASATKDFRFIYRGVVDPKNRSPRIISIAPVSDVSYLNASLLRFDPVSPPIRLASPEGFIMLYTSVPGLQGTLVIARFDLSGKIIWQSDTGLDRAQLSQVLPAAGSTAFVGTRVSVPGKVSEPILVIVDHQSGKLSSCSLWQ